MRKPAWREAGSRAVALAGLLTLAGCNALPASGPTGSQIIDGANSTRNQLGFKIIDLNAATISAFTAAALPAFAGLEPGDPTGRNLGRIGPGDTLEISIFEVGNSLFSQQAMPEDLESPTSGPQEAASTTTLPYIEVDGTGHINVPYAGSILAAGETPQSLGAHIQAALSGQSQNP